MVAVLLMPGAASQLVFWIGARPLFATGGVIAASGDFLASNTKHAGTPRVIKQTKTSDLQLL